jgi:phosphatidylglycerophosphate synthase
MKYNYSDIEKSFHSKEPWINIFIFRFLTLPLTYFLVNYTNITPNVITLSSAIFGIFAAYFYATNLILYGVISYLLSYLMDAIDGKIARIKNIKTNYGSWLDIFVDRFNFVIITISLSCSFLIEINIYFAIIAPSLLIGLFLIGFESRNNIQADKIKRYIKDKNYKYMHAWSLTSDNNDNKDYKNTSHFLIKYIKWTSKKQLISSPISLPEILFFLFVISPLMDIFEFSVIGMIILLLLRLLKQQLYWMIRK